MWTNVFNCRIYSLSMSNGLMTTHLRDYNVYKREYLERL